MRRMGELAKELGVKKPLIVTDKILVKIGVVQPCIDSLTEAGLGSAVFDDVVPNPHSELVEEGYARYVEAGCDAIVAFGGGSPMDCAKVIGAKVANPKDVRDYWGILKVTQFGLKALPPLIAVPTTAGTGSETTIAAIITMKEDKAKITIADPGLVPRVAVLDPEILVKLPKAITAATGMEVLSTYHQTG